MSKVSSCCGAAARDINNDCSTEDFGICPECREHCEYIDDEAEECPICGRTDTHVHDGDTLK